MGICWNKSSIKDLDCKESKGSGGSRGGNNRIVVKALLGRGRDNQEYPMSNRKSPMSKGRAALGFLR